MASGPDKNIFRATAHDMRGSLTNLKLASQQLFRHFEEVEDEEGKFYAEIIQRNCDKMEEQIEKMHKEGKDWMVLNKK